MGSTKRKQIIKELDEKMNLGDPWLKLNSGVWELWTNRLLSDGERYEIKQYKCLSKVIFKVRDTNERILKA